MRDMKRDKKKRRKYKKFIASAFGNNLKDPFIIKIEKTFHISYDQDLKFIDEDDILLINAKSFKQQ